MSFAKSNFIRGLGVIPSALEDSKDELLLITDATIISGKLVKNADDLEKGSIFQSTYSALTESLNENRKKLFTKFSKGFSDKSTFSKFKIDYLQNQEDIIFMKDVKIIKIGSTSQTDIPFLAVDTSKVIGATWGSANITSSQD
ncbi:hypothetical protein GQR93_09875 [Lentilactobacillus hilgardii]|uniref:Uncharacterized protein n=1 Tax=Lentilactobacillus hilgardii TaxID=1588 RepID=A0A6P1E8K5_LENHI|nr:hypothetical protein [Lentilactobacillus hilgardii]QHB52480.1 hypothetical protein GQR93_09875 [Lentilactobacillus hilgardii]